MADKNKITKKAGKTFSIYSTVKDGVQGVLKDMAVTKYYTINEFYKPELVAKALEGVAVTKVEYQTAQGTTKQIDTKAIKQTLTNNIDQLKAFYDKQQLKPLAVITYKVITDDAIVKLTGYFTLETLKPTQWTPQNVDMHRSINGATEHNVKANAIRVEGDYTGYLVNDPEGLKQAINELEPAEYKEFTSAEILTSPEGNSVDGLRELMQGVIDIANACGLQDDSGRVMSIGDLTVTQMHLELLGIISQTLAGVLARNKPVEQTNLFANMTYGVDTAEITGRHQFFSPMFRGFSELGESGLYQAIETANRRNNNVTIPYKTTGNTSVYRTKLQTRVDISGVEKTLIDDEAKAQRFTARLIKTQGILYLWAMHTNSLTIYNTKIQDMLRLAGYEGRIKPEHYTDITEGIAGLFAIAVTKTDDHYTDPTTGKEIYVGKNEMYGEVVRPIGEVQAVWHIGPDGKPAYIKKLVRLEIAKGMLNPTARRATLVSKALLRLNTLQERQYIQLGSFISDIFSQYQRQTVNGEPITIALRTLLEWRGLNSSDDLRRVDQTKTYIKQALDKLVDIGHIAKWTVKNGSYSKLSLSGKDLDTIILIYPTKTVQDALRPTISDDDKELTALLKQEVNKDGLAITADHYATDTDTIEAVINNRDTADSLPIKAYNELKTKSYDNKKAVKIRRNKQ